VTSVRNAMIIGGGIAGPATAMALQMAGIDPVVYEARLATADRTGTFLTVATNGISALRVLGAGQAILDPGFPTPSITLRGSRGKQLGANSTGWTLPDGTTSHTIKRADLYLALHEQARQRGIPVEFGKRLVTAEQAGQGVRAAFADGGSAEADLLIGCDGVHSAVRQVIDPGAPKPSYLGLINIGGYASGASVQSKPGSYEMIFGRRAFFGYALAPDGEVWWFANVPQPREPAHGEVQATDPEEWRRRLLGLFADDAGPAVRLIEATPQLSPASPIHAIAHLPAWHRDRMIVIGDAAHAPSPTSGQGASLSLEDAVVLAQCLRDLPTPAAAFARFEAARRRRAERIVRWAARISSSKAAGPVGRVIRDALMPMFMKMAATSPMMKEIYGYRLEWDQSRSAPG
jgi:2-polyprenyl-6-methoxyphenol hydroxylase-like FAD-dependent oxidoreductase